MKYNYILGISPGLLMERSLADHNLLPKVLRTCCELDGYQAVDIFFAEEPEIRREQLRILGGSGKRVNYISPPSHQDPINDPGALDDGRWNASIELTRRHMDFAAESGSEIYVVTAGHDDGADLRAAKQERFAAYLHRVCEYAATLGLEVVMEPIERRRFKRMLYGPTCECAKLVADLRQEGCSNLSLMMDTAHLPLMEERFADALQESEAVGLRHVHLGNAVLREGMPLYGHAHAPYGIAGGEFGPEQLSEQMEGFFRMGYLSTDAHRAPASLTFEVQPYPGFSGQTSAQLLRCMLEYALDAGYERYALKDR